MIIHTTTVFLFGLAVGSFINVCVYRIPRGMSIVAPQSHCPKCNKKLTPGELIPLLSFIILKGKCKTCGESISMRYPLIEILTGMVFVLTLFYGKSLRNWPTAIFIAFLALTVSFIDIDFKIVPDSLVLAGIVWWIVDTLLIKSTTVYNSLGGLSVGSGVLLVLTMVSRGGMGMGDVKIAGVYGLFLAATGACLMLFIASLTGAAFGIVMVILRKRRFKDPIPFGPFLSMASLVVLLWGDALLKWYINLF